MGKREGKVAAITGAHHKRSTHGFAGSCPHATGLRCGGAESEVAIPRGHAVHFIFPGHCTPYEARPPASWF
jgi:hypothetical protein